MPSPKILYPLIFVFIANISCKKYLDEKPLKSQIVPSTLNDLQALLDNYRNLNWQGPELLEALSDNYFITSATYSTHTTTDQMNYTWDKDATDYYNWFTPYTNPIYYSNIVLDQLPKITYATSDQPILNNIKGSALFYRSFAFYQIAQQYCKPFSSTASSDLGIVLRVTSDINVPSARSTVKETYEKIIGDLKEAINLLPLHPLYPTRPSKLAAYGALARAYISMRDYENAGLYADSLLQINDTLIDYNTLDSTIRPVFKNYNSEIVFYSQEQGPLVIRVNGGLVDSTLYRSYDANDLRKTFFFTDNLDGTYGFSGSYEGTSDFLPFDGIVTDEIYLIQAECLARSGNKDAALASLNTLLTSRWKTGSFKPFTATTSSEALNIILSERRKELLYRGLRWTDIRRLNLEGAGITLTRIVNGNTYTLPPNDLRSILLIPKEVLALTTLQQNPR
ncbi:MAG: RagB/SusD family nutrient uptake outer membrane protein [Chitinophagaceae bacterium]|nr:RagB/SusD family nutrient uptake outer membrane protein [Chitinophagaceae bacterium]